LIHLFIFVSLGLIILIVSGDFLVNGAVGVSRRLGIPKLIVGLTVIAFGTSAPELVISVRAVLEGVSGLAIGNVVGSNIANILLVLGLPAAIMGLPMMKEESRKPYLIMLSSNIVFITICFFWQLNRVSGIILILILLAVILDNVFNSTKSFSNENFSENTGEDDYKNRLSKYVFLVILGIIGLPIGANIFVDNAILIADQLGVSEAVIGLTLVAIGTSLPELSTMIMAIIRRENEMALGNVIGSNLFNLLAIMGIASIFGTITIPPEFFKFDIWFMLFTSLLLIPLVFKSLSLNRIWGFLFILIYMAYIVLVINRGT